MTSRVTTLVALILVLVSTTSRASTRSRAMRGKVKPTVEFATSWEAAVAQARLLNVPVVVHIHGFT